MRPLMITDKVHLTEPLVTQRQALTDFVRRRIRKVIPDKKQKYTDAAK